MVDKCIFEGCPKNAKFFCACSNQAKFCSGHVSLHPSQVGEHKIERLFPELDKAKLISESLKVKTSVIIDYGEQQIKDVFDKMRSMIELLNKRQKKILTTAYSGSLSQDVIKNMGDISIDFNIEKELEGFKSSLVKPDREALELYLEKFDKISTNITAGNEIMDKISEGLSQKFSDQENTTKEIRSQLHSLQNSIDLNKDIIEKNRKKESEAIKQFVDDKSKSISSELSLKAAEIYKTVDDKNKVLFNDFKALDSEIRIKVKQNNDEIQAKLKKEYDASLKSCDDNYKDLDAKFQKLQKQIKEFHTTIGEFTNRYEQQQEKIRLEQIEKDRKAKEERDIKVARDKKEKEDRAREEAENKKNQQESSNRSRELLTSTETFERDFKTMRPQLEAFIQRLTKLGIPDRVELESTLGTLTQSIGILEERNIRLRKSVSLELNGQEAVNMNNDTITLIVHLTEFNQICKSFLAMLVAIDAWNHINANYCKSFKLTKDKQYYFYCN